MYDQDRKPGPFVLGRVQVQEVSLSLGNYVWVDNNNNGRTDGGEPPAPNGVIVELLDGSGASLNRQTQTQNGYYLFTGLNIGEYRVRLAASNFANGGLLQTYGHSTGVGQEGDPNSNGDQNDNGLDTTEPAVAGIMSAKVALGHDEPTGETPTASGTPGADGAGTSDQDSNLTVDFGVVPSTSMYSLGNFVGAGANNDGQIDIGTDRNPCLCPMAWY
ncbi:MAG: SdrD B-like domain-containing protein [Caldilineaceae bacterium]